MGTKEWSVRIGEVGARAGRKRKSSNRVNGHGGKRIKIQQRKYWMDTSIRCLPCRGYCCKISLLVYFVHVRKIINVF